MHYLATVLEILSVLAAFAMILGVGFGQPHGVLSFLAALNLALVGCIVGIALGDYYGQGPWVQAAVAAILAAIALSFFLVRWPRRRAGGGGLRRASGPLMG